ncbi:uncharacterized protein PRCAT00000421001 [Priceomyces carsonii]|uniref:uncharacterized protein n=1 Tax=Priceomyces carsonii TaxID=28549 RepID=UPI002EDADD4C|nr:unnamed protein product [Priceomyces carsonii]
MSNSVTPGNEVKRPKTSTHLIAGGMAGLVSAVALQPFDLLKTRLQQQQLINKKYQPTISKELKKLTTLKDLWRGVLPSMLRTSIGSGLYFTILSSFRSRLAALKTSQVASKSSILPRLSPMENLATGFVVRAIVGLITMPITIMKTRFESNIYNYNSMYEGIESIYLNDEKSSRGSIKNFFRGSFATLARDCPYAGLYVLFYESFKNNIVPTIVIPLHQHLIPDSSLINSTSAVLAASTATTITAPFDAIKTRLQLNSSDAPTSGIWKTTIQLLRENGGIRNLFRGLSLRLGRKGMSAGIVWCIYEELIKKDTQEILLRSGSKIA